MTGVGVGLGFLDMRVDLEDDPEDGGGGGSPSSPGRALVPLDDTSTPSALSSVNVTPKQGTSPATAQGAGRGGGQGDAGHGTTSPARGHLGVGFL